VNSRFVLGLRTPRTVIIGDGAGVCLTLADRTVTLAEVPRSVRSALAGLAEGAACAQLSSVADDGSAESLAVWYYCLELLQRAGCLICEVVDAGRPLARALAGPAFQPGLGNASETCQWALSRFAYMQYEHSGLVMKSASCGACVELLDSRLVCLTTALARPTLVSEAIARCGDVSPMGARDFVDLLEYSGMLTRVEAGVRTEDSSPALASWEFVDLLFHRSSRAFRGSPREPARNVPCPPAVRPPMSDRVVDLHVPDVELLERSDVPFTRVLERRRSVREHGAPMISLGQVGEFLYRAARVKRVFAPDDRGDGHELTERPYPGAGACYELETYLAVTHCGGLAPGLYHYEPLRHRLESISCDRADVARLNHDASLTAGSRGDQQVLVILAARFNRLATKYGAGSYALILKDAGVLLQTMSLVAAAMGLGSCILGSGDSALFARAVGTHPYEESSVAELLLGSSTDQQGSAPA
jgi:SagB-type dehydrogenase family enzyme